jgi:hypothetical protein
MGWMGWRIETPTLFVSCCCIGNPSLSICYTPHYHRIVHLKLHTVGDVNLSHCSGIAFEFAGSESIHEFNFDGWYD